MPIIYNFYQSSEITTFLSIMQAIDNKKHQNMTRAIGQYEEYFTHCEAMIHENQNEIVRENIAKFKDAYDYYKILLKELEGCLEQYKEVHESLQRMVYPYARKMSGELRRKKRI